VRQLSSHIFGFDARWLSAGKRSNQGFASTAKNAESAETRIEPLIEYLAIALSAPPRETIVVPTNPFSRKSAWFFTELHVAAFSASAFWPFL
jgi:hypothetical protein